MSRRESSTPPALRLKTSTLSINMNRTPHSLGNTPVNISPEITDILDAFKGPYCGWHWVYEPRKDLALETSQLSTSSSTQTQPTSAPLEYTYSSSSSASSQK